MNGWIGVDLDGTLAHYEKFEGPEIIGKPVPIMLNRVRAWLNEGRDVRIFTARVWPIGTTFALSEDNAFRLREAQLAYKTIKDWCLEHLGQELPITCTKDYGMIELWDDRAVQVRTNTGEPIGVSTRGLF